MLALELAGVLVFIVTLAALISGQMRYAFHCLICICRKENNFECFSGEALCLTNWVVICFFYLLINAGNDSIAYLSCTISEVTTHSIPVYI